MPCGYGMMCSPVVITPLLVVLIFFIHIVRTHLLVVLIFSILYFVFVFRSSINAASNVKLFLTV